MSENIMRAGLDGSGYVDGARVITKANLDIMDSTNKAQGAMATLEGRFGGIGSKASTGCGAARAALESMESPLSSVKSMIEQVESRIIRIGATVLIFRALGESIGIVNRFFSSGIKNVEDYQNILISMAASLTQVAIMNNKDGSKSVPQMYAESARYAGVLAEKMREVDVNSSANYDQIMSMLQVYTSTGRVLDVNNKTQMAGFTALSNAIPAMTKGQDVTRQMTTEMRAFATGTLTAGSTIAKMVDSMAKADGVKGGLKELIRIGDASGRSVLEVAAKYLEGFTAAIPAIAQTITTAKTSLETAIGASQRKIFAPVVSDLVMIIQGAIKTVGDGTNTVANLVQSAWSSVKNTLFDVATITSSTGKLSEVLIIKPEVMEGLKSFGNVVMWAGSIIKSTTLFITEHLDAITKLGIAYGIRKAIVGATNLTMLAYNSVTSTGTSLTELNNIATERATVLAKERALAEKILNDTLMTRHFDNGTVPIASGGTVNLVDPSAASKIESNIALTASNLRVAETNTAKAQSELASAVATRNSINTDIVAQTVMVESLAVKIASSEANVAYAESEVARTSANLANNTALIESITLEMDYLSASAVSIERQQQLKILKNELATASFRQNGITTAAIAAEEQLSVATNIQTSLLQKQVVATDSLVASQRALDASNNLVGMSASKATLVEFAQTEALAANTLATEWNTAQQTLFAVGTNVARNSTAGYTLGLAAATIASESLALATTALNGALALVGGPLGAILLTLYAGYLAWERWGNAAEKAKKQAGLTTEDTQKVIDGINKQNEATKSQIELEKKLASGSITLDRLPEKDKLLVALGSERDLYFKLGGEVTRYGIELGELEARKVSLASQGFTLSRDQQEQFNAEKQRILSLKNARATEMEDLKKAALLRQSLQPLAPKSMPLTPPSVPEATSKQISIENAWIAFTSGFYKNQISLVKEQERTKQAIIEESYKSAEITQQEYLQKTYDNQTKSLNMEIDFAKQSLSVVKDKLDKQSTLTGSVVTTDGNGYIVTEPLLGNPPLSTDKQATSDYKKNAANRAEDLKLAREYNDLLLVLNVLLEKASQTSNQFDINKLKAHNDEIKKLQELTTQYDVLKNTVEAFNASQVGVDSSTGIITEAKANSIAMVNAEYDKTIDKLEDAYNKNVDEYNSYKTTAEAKIIISNNLDLLDEQINQAEIKRKQNLAKANSSAFYGMREAIADYGNKAANVGAQVKSAFDSAFSSLTNSLAEFLKTGKLSLTSFFDSIRNSLAQMAATKIMVNIGASITSSLIGTAATAATTAGINGATSTAAGTAGTAGLLGGLTASGSGAMFGTELAAGYTGGMGMFASGSMAASIGAIASIAVPIAVAAAGVYAIAKFGFGWGNSYKSIGSGTDISVSNGQISGQTWEEFKKKGGWFTSDKYRTEYKALTDEQAMELRRTFNAMNEGLAMQASILGKSGDETKAILDSIVITTDKNKTGMGVYGDALATSMLSLTKQKSILHEAVYGYLGAENNDETYILEEAYIEMQTVSNEVYVMAGESYTNAADRIISTVSLMQHFFAQTGQAIESMSVSTLQDVGNNLSNNIVKNYTGDTYSDKIQAAYEAQSSYASSSLFTSEEQAANKVNDALLTVKNTFESLGMEIPTSNEAFKDLVNEQFNLATGSGDAAEKAGEFYKSLLGVASAFAETTKISETLSESMSTFLGSSLDSANALKDLMSGSLSTLSPVEQYQQQLTAYNDAITSGNDSAVIDLAKTFLEASQARYGSGTAYTNDYNSVTNQLASMAGISGDLSYSSVDAQVQKLTDLQDALTKGTADTVAAIEALQAEVAQLRKDAAIAAAKQVEATNASAEVVADSVSGTVSATTRL